MWFADYADAVGWALISFGVGWYAQFTADLTGTGPFVITYGS